MLNKFSLITFTILSALLFTSCDKDDPIIVDQEELITTLNYTLTSSDGTVIVLSFQDLDGDGGNAPTISGGTLAANETYSGSLELLNETETPAESITEEIQEEDEEHQFFFQSDIAGVTFDYNDQDADGNPTGLVSTLTTGASGTGSITVILRHEPAKDADNVSSGDITNAGGETDIEVTFPIEVQ